MRNFLITLVVSTVASNVLWQFGLVFRIWPSHPFLATVMIAAGVGVAVELLLSADARAERPGIPPKRG